VRQGERVRRSVKSSAQSKKLSRTKRKIVKRQTIFKSSSWYERAASLFSAASSRG